MASSTVLKLGFVTENDKSVSINITDPASSLNDAMIQDAMDDMISSGVVSKSSGVIKTRKYARLVTTETTDIEIPE